MSQIKSIEEVAYIKKACKITDEIFLEVILYIKKQIKQKYIPTEIEVQEYILQKIKDRKLRPSFNPIVTSGKRGGNEIHPRATSCSLERFTIIDLGVRYKGYCSDMTRTIYIGIPTQMEKDVYKYILNSERLGIKLAIAGASCSEIDHHVRESLGMYKKYFIHTLGHGVGKKIHEHPIIYEKRIRPILKEGMVITIEPGIYIKNKVGIRIEDTILITQKAPEILTKSTKRLLFIA